MWVSSIALNNSSVTIPKSVAIDTTLSPNSNLKPKGSKASCIVLNGITVKSANS